MEGISTSTFDKSSSALIGFDSLRLFMQGSVVELPKKRRLFKLAKSANHKLIHRSNRSVGRYAREGRKASFNLLHQLNQSESATSPEGAPKLKLQHLILQLVTIILMFRELQ
jgi:hypothetical protein